MVDYSKPITDGDIKKAKTWYDIVCWGGLLIVLLCQPHSWLPDG